MSTDNICFGCMNPIKGGTTICPICGYDCSGRKKKQKARCLKPGTLLRKKYFIGRVLGEGGFGITYIAKNIQDGEILAVKEYFPSELAYRDVFSSEGNRILVGGTQKKRFYEIGLKNFEKEAKNLLLFQELDGIVKVKDYFQDNQSAYIVMEYVKGISLKAYLKKRRKPLNEKQTLKMMKPIFYALEQIHQKKMIHRDISPENIILDHSGKVTLIDFGAARMATGEETQSLTVLLKHGYAPIEQYQAKGRQGPATDIYALCATMYELMSMRVPKRSVERAQRDTMPTLKELAKTDSNIRVSSAVSKVIQRGMEVQQENRYANMDCFCRELYQREDWRHATKTITSSNTPKKIEKERLDSSTQRFLQERKRSFEYERKKEEKLRMQEEYQRQQEYKRKKKEEREQRQILQKELDWRQEQERLKKEYEKQEQRKQEKRLLEEEKQRKLQKEEKKQKISYRTLQSVKMEGKKKRNRDLWYSEYEQEGIDQNVAKKRKIFLVFGLLSLTLCITMILILSRKNGENRVYFGTYPQSEITGSAITKEIQEAEYDSNKFATVNEKRYRRAGKYFYVFDKIEWRVLAREDGKVLLVSQNILDAQAFSSPEQEIVSWKDSSLRTWLNTYFYDAAFSESEKKAIVESTILTETVGSEEVETEDKVFLLSTAEVQDRGYYFTDNEERVAKKSVYAVRRGAETGGENSGRWWLRTPGSRENTVQVVRANGSLAENSYTVLSSDCGVRPAIWVDETYFEK